MWQHGQRVQRHEVEIWIAERYPHEYFLADVQEREEVGKQRVRIVVTLTGPSGESLWLDNERTATYYALRDMIGMPQPVSDWTV